MEELVETGLSTRAIAARLGVGQTAVRYWLARYGLVTRSSSRRRANADARSTGGGDVEIVCPLHGRTTHRVRSDFGIACLRCRSESVARRRRRIKELLVREAGGRCQVCGYCRSHAALVFHHVDPTRKRFGLAEGGQTRSLARARKEARNCLLLCANCHAEVEVGAAVLALSPVQVDPG